MDIDVGFGKVLRVRWLKAKPERKHLIRPKVETLSQKKVRHDKALDLLERRKAARLQGLSTPTLDGEIRRMGFEFEDEPSCEDGRYSYWAKR